MVLAMIPGEIGSLATRKNWCAIVFRCSILSSCRGIEEVRQRRNSNNIDGGIEVVYAAWNVVRVILVRVVCKNQSERSKIALFCYFSFTSCHANLGRLDVTNE